MPVDILLIAFGVNDSTAFHSVARWERDLRALLTALEARCKPGMIVLAGVPPLEKFPALPQPLRWVMGLKGRALDAAARRIAAGSTNIRHVGFALAPSDSGLMASDGFHPSVHGCQAWAAQLTTACLPPGGASRSPNP